VDGIWIGDVPLVSLTIIINRICLFTQFAGSTLKSRYTSALRILETLPNEIRKLSPGKTDDDWRHMFHEECKYFEGLQDPSPESSFAMLYVKRLRVLAEKK
jgi:hypothetical protein